MYPRDTRGGLARLASESTALLEIGSILAMQKKLRKLVRPGGGHPVVLIPGFTATDRLMGRLRRFLVSCDYSPVGWGQGRNTGIRRDALAPWPFCLDETDEHSENIRVPGSHTAMPYNPLMYYVIADRLAQEPGDWRPFDTSGLRGALYRKTCPRDFPWYEG